VSLVGFMVLTTPPVKRVKPLQPKSLVSSTENRFLHGCCSRKWVMPIALFTVTQFKPPLLEVATKGFHLRGVA